jgi:drug/metabolite transporter (DMT)-like permease
LDIKSAGRTSARASIITGFLSAIVAAALFGSVSTVAKPILSSLSPILLSTLVYLIAGLTFTPIAYTTGKSKTHAKYYALVVISGIIGAAIAPTMFFLGLQQTTATDSSLLVNGETVFSILFALLLFKEKIRPPVYVAIFLILAGLFIVTTNFRFGESVFNMNSGNLLIIAATMIWGLDNNVNKIIARHMNVAKLVQLKSLIGGGISFLILLALNVPLVIHTEQIIPILIVGVFGFAISLFLYLHAIKRIGVVKASSLLSLSAVFGLTFAAIFLGEPVSMSQIIAVVVMFIGIYMMYRYEVKMQVLK